MIRNHVSFETAGPTKVEAGGNAAEPLARDILRELEARGFAVEPLAGLDYAFDFRLRTGGRSFYGMLGPTDDGIRQWLMFLESELSAWRRLLGSSDDAVHRSALRALHEVLSADPRVRSIRWYTAQDWNEAPDERWHPDPGPER